MDHRKFIKITLLSLSLVVLISARALAERNCTRQVVHADGTTTVDFSCTSTDSHPSEHFWSSWFYNDMFNNLLERVQEGLQSFRDRITNSSSVEDKSKQFSANIREKEEGSREAQQRKQQDQEAKLEDLKERQEMLKQQQDSRR
jgi:hypothetical protein